jgi:hypothetical protein
MKNIKILPFGCNYQLAYNDKIEVIGITEDPYIFNRSKSLPPELMDAVEDIIGVKSGGYNFVLCLVSDGMVVGSSSGDIREINNRFIAYYNSVYIIGEMCRQYGMYSSPINREVKISYTEMAVSLLDKYIDLFHNKSTFNNKSVIKEAKSLREKILTLHAIFNKDTLASLHFVSMSRSDVLMKMALDFSMLKGLKEGDTVMTGWQCIQKELELFPYIAPTDKNPDVSKLSEFILKVLNGILIGLTEYRDSNGVINHNIVSLDAGKVFYDIDKKCTFRDLR